MSVVAKSITESGPPLEAELRWNLSAVFQRIDASDFVTAFQQGHRQAKALQARGKALAASETDLTPDDLDQFDQDWQTNRDAIQELFVFVEAHLLLGDARPVVSKARDAVTKLAVLSQQAPRPIVAKIRTLDADGRDAVLQGLSEKSTRDRYSQWLWAPSRKTMRNASEAKFRYHSLLDKLNWPVPELGPGKTMHAKVARRALWDASPNKRQAMFEAMQTAWAGHSDLVARAIHERCASPPGALPFADALNEGGIGDGTAQAVRQALWSARKEMRRVTDLMARLLGKDQVHLLDIVGCPDKAGRLSLSQTIQDVRRAFASIDPDMARFLDTALERGWIDARSTRAGRSVNDLQTAISRRGHPLVLVNFDGLPRNAIRFAHECAHAYHFHLVRDLPAERHAIPLPLAETVSAVAEQALRDIWSRDGLGGSRIAAYRFAWMEAESLFAGMLQLPMNAAFDYCVAAFDAPPSPSELSAASASLAADWLGPNLQGHDATSWVSAPSFVTARRLHNLPYMIGYLAAQSLTPPQAPDGQDIQHLLVTMANTPSETVLSRILQGPVDELATWEAATGRVQDRLNALSDYVEEMNLEETP